MSAREPALGAGAPVEKSPRAAGARGDVLGRSTLPAREPSSHELLLYRDRGRRHEVVASWVEAGLDQGEKVLYTDSAEDTELFAALAALGADVALSRRTGRLGVLPLQELHPDSGRAELVASALVDDFGGVRLLGHGTAALTLFSDPDYQRIERVMDHLCTGMGVSVLCQYDARRTSGPRLDSAVDLHPHAIRGDDVELRRRGARLCLTGHLDLGFAEPLMLGLRRASADQQMGVLTVDVSGLTFLDVAGSRALLVGTRDFRLAGGSLVLENPQPSVRRLLSLLGMQKQDRVSVI